MQIKEHNVFASTAEYTLSLDVSDDLDHAIICMIHAAQIKNEMGQTNNIIEISKILNRVQSAADVIRKVEEELDQKLPKL